MKAWHFTNGALRNGDPIPADGEVLRWDGDCVMCESGLHASERIIDALKYAPGNMIHRVECDGIEDTHDDKLVCRARTILWRINGETLLRDFARQCAFDVIQLWEAPRIVRDYLETGDESKRAAARAAAWAAAGGAARAAQNERLEKMVREARNASE